MTAMFDQPTRVLVAANGATPAVRRALHAACGTADEVAAPTEALRRAQSTQYDAILVDLTLPQAFELLGELSKCAPVVVLVEQEATGLKALLAGAAAVISKRVRPQELIGTLIRIGLRESLQTRTKSLLARLDEACAEYCRDSKSPFPA